MTGAGAGAVRVGMAVVCGVGMEEADVLGGRGGGGVCVAQTDESEADRERDSSLKEVLCEATDDRGEVPPPPFAACLPRAADVGVLGPPDAVPPPPGSRSTFSSSRAL